ncbi:MAG: class I SAM-dependent methyltransferase [Burkholderiales bacterium]|nr:class I SAM-dependent methyltransferase [Burkholderiales bacterium]
MDGPGGERSGAGSGGGSARSGAGNEASEGDHRAELFLRGAQEYRWLAAQARVWEPATRRALQAAGLAAGQSVLDAGCGTCEVLPLLAERVGPGGRVTGLDIDGPLAEQALRQLSRGPPLAALPGVCRIVAGDLLALPQVAVGPFDFVFARSLIFDTARPAMRPTPTSRSEARRLQPPPSAHSLPLPHLAHALLRRLWALVRAGGTLLVIEHDVTAMRPLAPQAAFERATRLIGAATRAPPLDAATGTQLPRLFEAAGIGAVDGCDVSSAIEPAAPSAALLRSLLADARDTLIAVALADEIELHRLDGDLAAADEACLRWPDLVAAWKRKAA